MASASAPRPGHGVLHFGDQGHHIAGVSGIPHRQRKGEDEARGGLGDKPGLAAKLGGAVALALANRGNRGIVGIDDFTLGQEFALGESTGLGGNLLMGGESAAELGVQALPLLCGQLHRALHALLGGPRQPATGFPVVSSCVSVWRTKLTNTLLCPRH